MNISELETIEQIIEGFESKGYVMDTELATIVFLLLKLQKPLLIEGHTGVGKTELANQLANFLDTELIRLQCYEGLDLGSAVYEWNYQKQLLTIKIQEQSQKTEAEKERHIFSDEFLMERPLLKSIRADKPVVLLIDEIDRSDEEFEAFLLELLSAFQISIPELGTIKAKHIPFVILTSNRSRELGDALKRRCLYYWVDYPDLEKELKILQKRLPHIEEDLSMQIVQFVQKIRKLRLSKTPGIAETLDWAQGLLALGKKELDPATVKLTQGCLLKSSEDAELLASEDVRKFIENIP
ncbi:MAG: MoxR family ATPase [Microscillaceae bacterium]|nr:MoxR family ATPase [Microscillaceae bacterium]